MIKTKEQSENLGNQKPTYSILLYLAFPIILANISHSILTFSDRYFISKLGMKEAAAGALSSSVTWVMFMLVGFVAGGTRAIVSRKRGEDNQSEMNVAIEQSIILGVIFGTFVYLLGTFGANFLFDFFKADKDVTALGVSYYRIFLLGYPAMFISVILTSAYQAVGNPKIPMVIFSFLSLLNLVLDPIFIYGIGPLEGMGIKGAALATSVSELSALTWLFYNFYKSFGIKALYKLRIQKEMIKRILTIGKWTGLSSFSRPLSGLYFQRIVAFYGTHAIAAFGFSIQWLSLSFIFVESISIALMTLVGQYLGAQRVDYLKLAIKKAYIFVTIFITLTISLTVIFAKEAMMIFSNNTEIIEIGESYLQIVMTSLIFVIPMVISRASFSGSGDTKPPMIASFIANWPVKIIFAYVTTYTLSLSIIWVWYAVALSIIVEASILYFWYKKGDWLHKKI